MGVLITSMIDCMGSLHLDGPRTCIGRYDAAALNIIEFLRSSISVC